MYSFNMKCKIFVESHVYNKIKKKLSNGILLIFLCPNLIITYV